MEKTCFNYTNQTQKIQIVRIHIGLNQYLEKAVFPHNFFSFDAPFDAHLEVFTYAIATSVLSDIIYCQKLNHPESLQPRLT